MYNSLPARCTARHPLLRVRCDRREHERGTAAQRGRHRAEIVNPDRPDSAGIVEWFS